MGKLEEVNPTPNPGGETVPGSDVPTSTTTTAAAPEKRESRDENIGHVNSAPDDVDDTKIVSDEERDYAGTVKKTDPEEIALVRKLDWRVMVRGRPPRATASIVMLTNFHLQPTLCIMYFLNYVDRNAIAQARLNDLEEDLGMTGTQFNTAVSM